MNPKLIATLLIVLGFTELASVDGKVALTKEDVGKLQAEHQKKFGAPLTLEGLAYDEDGYASFQEAEILSIEAALAKKAPAKPKSTTEDPPSVDPVIVELQSTVTELKGKLTAMELAQQQSQATIIKLGQQPEDDVPHAGAGSPNKAVFMHSKTHLFSSKQSFDAYENRPWNARAASNVKVEATDYTPMDITQLNTDLGAYYRENQTALISFLRAKNRLPAFWNTVSNVQDQIAYAKAFTGEVTQARKKKWLPKGSFEFQPEIAKVYPIQIDITILGSELQSMETSWMNHLESIKKDGSKPYKMSFVAYLAGEILKKAAEEDQIAHIRGIYIPTADDATVAGLSIHKQNGLLIGIKAAQARRVYMPYDLGVPTEENILDYVETLVKRIPEYWRDMPGMVLYMANYWRDAYLKRRETVKGLMPTFTEGKLTVDLHENIRLEGLSFLNDSKFMFVTTDDNISLMENIPSEKKILNMEMDKRDINIFGDYKTGIHVWAYGYEYPSGVDLSDDKQIFFSNDVEILPDSYVNIAADATIPSVQYHTSLRTGVNTQATAITDIADSAVGDYIYIIGNTGANPTTIANAGKFDLDAAITLDENTKILLYKRGAADFVEIERWDLALSNVVFLAADATTANAASGKHFVTAVNSAATAITNILNAVDGDVYLLEGGSDTNATTIAQSGYFSRISAAMTLGAGEWIKVRFNGLKFVELDRFEIA